MHRRLGAGRGRVRRGRGSSRVTAPGANLATVQALDGQARLQVLLYPVVDMLHQDGLYPSVVTFSKGYLLTGEGMQECARMLIPPEFDRGDPRLSPIRAELGAGRRRRWWWWPGSIRSGIRAWLTRRLSKRRG